MIKKEIQDREKEKIMEECGRVEYVLKSIKDTGRNRCLATEILISTRWKESRIEKKKAKGRRWKSQLLDICLWMVKQIFLLIFRVESREDDLDNDDNMRE